MQRALVSLIVAPLLVSLVFGVAALFVFPVMLVVSGIVAFPLFLLLKRFNALEWWHALLTGIICSVAYIAFDGLGRGFFDIDGLVSRNNVLYVGLGAAVGVLYWWLGVFRNPALPFVSREFPKSFVVVIPFAALLVLAHAHLDMIPSQGRLLAIVKPPASHSRRGLATVRLSSGEIVPTDFSDPWVDDALVGKCVHVMNRWSTLRFRRVWVFNGQFGGGVDDC